MNLTVGKKYIVTSDSLCIRTQPKEAIERAEVGSQVLYNGTTHRDFGTIKNLKCHQFTILDGAYCGCFIFLDADENPANYFRAK